jgi:hypothetical protein
MAGVFQNIDPPFPSPAGECVPPPLWVQGGGTFAVGEGVEDPIPTMGQTLWFSR